MGCSASKPVNPIDVKLVGALRAYKARQSGHSLTFNELLLHFPQMALGFQLSRALFNELDTNHDHLIDIAEFLAQAQKLGLDGSLDLREVFDAADLDHSANIDVHEFVLLIMMVHLLRPEQAGGMPPELLATLRVVEDAFCCFDTSADGYLEAAEVSAALQVCTTPGRTTSALGQRLFASLDLDASGGVSIKEFLIGLERMVLEEYGDDTGGASEDAAEFKRLREAAATARAASHAGGHA